QIEAARIFVGEGRFPFRDRHLVNLLGLLGAGPSGFPFNSKERMACLSQLVKCSIIAQTRNYVSSRFTASGSSCCTQWVAWGRWNTSAWSHSAALASARPVSRKASRSPQITRTGTLTRADPDPVERRTARVPVQHCGQRAGLGP